LFKFRCKSLSWMIIRRWLHLSKQGVTTDLLFLLCSQWQGIHRKLCVCRCIDYSPALKSWKRLSHEATANNNCPKQEESCDHSASSSCTLRTKQQECQFNAMLCDGFAMETLLGCFLLQSCLLLTSCRNAHLLIMRCRATTWLKVVKIRFGKKQV
jgi:hypothetical protein